MTVSTTRSFTAHVSLHCACNLTRRKRLVNACRLPSASVCNRHNASMKKWQSLLRSSVYTSTQHILRCVLHVLFWHWGTYCTVPDQSITEELQVLVVSVIHANRHHLCACERSQDKQVQGFPSNIYVVFRQYSDTGTDTGQISKSLQRTVSSRRAVLWCEENVHGPHSHLETA